MNKSIEELRIEATEALAAMPEEEVIAAVEKIMTPELYRYLTQLVTAAGDHNEATG